MSLRFWEIIQSIHSNAFESPFLSTAAQRRVTEQTFEAHRTKMAHRKASPQQ
jgi:hypothetical protein